MGQTENSAIAWNLAAILVVTCLTAVAIVSAAGKAREDGISSGKHRFANIFEPSGVQQLPDGRLIVIEDERQRPISQLKLNENGSLTSQPLALGSLLGLFAGKGNLRKLNDLEGIDADDNNFVYAVTSHSRNLRGKAPGQREKLIRFRVEDGRASDPRIIRKLKKRIIRKHPVLKDAAGVRKVQDGRGFNIEGLSFDRTRKKLLIGLRSPVIEGKAVIAVMTNPASAFERGEKPRISNQLIKLDLGKGGIRAIAFDTHLGGYLIISRREDKKDKKFKLWLWDGDAAHAPRRVRVPHKKRLMNAEGVTPLRHSRFNGILIVSDNGSAIKRKGGRYALISYDQLTIEGKPVPKLSAAK